jgi:hypothetical protein
VNYSSVLHLGRLIAVSAIVLPAPGYTALPSVFNADVPNDGATQSTTDASRDESFNASRHELAIAPPDLPLDTPGDDTIAQMTEQEILERLEQLEQEVEFLRQQLQSLEDTADTPVDGPVTAEGASSPQTRVLLRMQGASRSMLRCSTLDPPSMHPRHLR